MMHLISFLKRLHRLLRCLLWDHHPNDVKRLSPPGWRECDSCGWLWEEKQK